jgi:glutathione S-transferase
MGKKEEHIQEDQDEERAHVARIQKLQNEALARAREQRDHQRKIAANRLKEAREQEEKTKLALNNVYQELAASKYQLAEAKSNLDKTKSDLIFLSNKEVQLVSIVL